MVDKATNSTAQPVYVVSTPSALPAGDQPGGTSSNPSTVKSPAAVPLGYQQILAASTVSAVGLTVPAGATFAIVQATAQAARWRDDGVNPTTTVGMTLPAGGELVYDGDLTAIKFINAAAGTILDISYYN